MSATQPVTEMVYGEQATDKSQEGKKMMCVFPTSLELPRT